MMNKRMWLCVSIVMVACGSSAGSGVTGAKKLFQLTASERDQLCQYSVDVEHGPRSVTCETSTVEILDKPGCVANFGGIDAGCTATVDDAENCSEAVGRDPCNPDINACGALVTCILAPDGGAQNGHSPN
jgi:hypothetical protein